MERKIITKLNVYVFSIVIGTVLVLLEIFALILASKNNDASKIFLQGILLFTWTVYTIIYWVLYKKEKQKQKLNRS